MKLKLTWLMTLFMACVMSFSYAQEKTVTGTVTTSEDGLPLPGASVIVKGTTRGVQTDFDGRYSITANTGDVLVFSYVGTKTAEITMGASNVYDVALEFDNALEEVVVVGYSSTTKEAFTGTASIVDIEEIENKIVSNVTQALRGEIAGVNIVQRSGAPGSTAEVRIRGFGSVNGNQLPLYVVDGAPLTNNSREEVGINLNAINPADIESMVVLKDAAATSIYGSRGANGVILITTKQGKAGTSRISADFTTSVTSLVLPQYDIIESPEEYVEISWRALRNNATLNGLSNPAQYASSNIYSADGSGVGINSLYNIWNVPGNQLINPATGRFDPNVQRRFTPTTFGDAAFGTGKRTEANVQFSGGDEKTKFAGSIGYLDDEGYALNSRYTRYSTRLNLEHKPTEWLTVGANMAYTGARSRNSSDAEGDTGSSGNIFALVNTTPAIYDVFLRDQDGSLVSDPIFGGSQYDYGLGRRAWTNTNAVGVATYDLSQSDITTLLGNFNVGVKMTDWLNFEMRYSGQFQSAKNASRGNSFYGGAAATGGNLFLDDDLSTNQNFLQLLRYNQSFGQHSVEFFVAHESTEDRFKTIAAGSQTAILPNTLDLNQYTFPFGRASSFTQGWTLDSYFSQLNYNYDNKYYVTGSIRRDGSSRFKNNKWGTFGSVGLGWIVTKEDFMSDIRFLDFLKLKASYGAIGDQGTSLQYGYQIQLINSTSDGSYSFTESATLANPDLTWETSNIAQVGFESSWLGNRLNVDVDLYDKRTTNLFFTENLFPSIGSSLFQYNDGELTNRGIEFNVVGKIIENENLRLSVNVNGEIFDNEITRMPTGRGQSEPLVFDDNNNLAKGKSIFDWFMREWAGVDPGNGAALWNLYYDDINNDGIFNAGDTQISNLFTYQDENPGAQIGRTVTDTYANATQRFVGKSAIPKIRGGFRLNLGVKNFDVSAQFSYSLGGYTYDAGYSVLMGNDLVGADNFHTDIRNAWQQPGDITDVPRTSAQFGTDAQQNAFSTRFLTRSDFFALNNINLGYTLPKAAIDAIGLSTFRLFVAGDNLMMLSARRGLNPTTAIATTNSGAYTPVTTFSLGAKVEF
ncbi:SusC/RagA family TonB-linked outer membrane protein [Subsaximicrobium wynnwilliamsii]|uniref:SusC/RagA family TonB-linked outer membrane protein n=1 Tax=Subsaximicrobium wynnwilliamsii TaxID=291179 RepID=A0A5C6ZKZ9_9FLAO|nr:SusC/RagA family TonB-linked outer membrane protein [Subsaximicrobium wynnwilliamsii]TXD85357.1 SusC/RagA family TonB-linked outer membrane protein [Subsaximicrobium wynnwilliamsii]TXD90709.1 SusC/RagA family TonB-linked outer membrane protein [Subsaximicrobium wynnwilliamsii]TXE05217.1 SusC/RagA family TonB-linked outer membrane protein [Subsaximicrobium wynnwilliamsii]